MIGALGRCRYVPGWEKTYLEAIKQGYNNKTAANLAGVGTAEVNKRMGRDPKFKQRVEETVQNKKARPQGGMW